MSPKTGRHILLGTQVPTEHNSSTSRPTSAPRVWSRHQESLSKTVLHGVLEEGRRCGLKITLDGRCDNDVPPNEDLLSGVFNRNDWVTIYMLSCHIAYNGKAGQEHDDDDDDNAISEIIQRIFRGLNGKLLYLLSLLI
ncbi:hypothetical protein DPMN_158859 [Dreissena polymorpha]|uniref:Uncharacterized protein n=1 Tax=Dreissena polymorpha TaxID=45954 RepID=A0A9D4EKJ1_DREPO|nr:hypothetical protein DPMN_158859 [Dreissena polymorpha]